MQRHGRISLAGLATALIAVAAAACENATSPDPATSHQHDAAFVVTDRAESPEIREWLADLRRRTARYKRFGAAMRAGYSAQITDCMVNPPAGGMGFHYGKPELIDGNVNAKAPEVLLYEPRPNGGLEFVAVEYIVPFTAWTQPDPPELNGVTFRANQTFQVWALHVWIDKRNPSGMFADWNPQVSCEHAS